MPWVSVELAGGSYDLGNMHNTRVNRCFVERRCQICGEHIGALVVFFLSTSGLADMSVGEPPVHPECAAYSKRACPMLAGRVDHYRRTPTRTEGHRGEQCTTPGCDCGGWIPTPGNSDNAGRSAEAWHMVWCNTYALTVPDAHTKGLLERGLIPAGVQIGARVTQPLKIRAVAP